MILRVRCPAKVNLHLEILGRRADGFHEIRTVFQTIDLWDEIEAEPAPGLVLRCDDPALPSGEDNLVLRAAARLREAAGRPELGARLRLRKGIPTAGGLGGGSSDAAGTLRLLSALWGLSDGDVDLPTLAAGLGSDCAFFLAGGTAVGTGRGEILDPVPVGGSFPLVLGFPPFGIATAEVYGRLASRAVPLTPLASGVTLRALFVKWPREKDFGPVRNDLEPVVIDGWPELGEFRARLAECGASLSLVSGSGSTVFGAFGTGEAADAAARRLEEAFPSWRVRRSRTVSEGVAPVG